MKTGVTENGSETVFDRLHKKALCKQIEGKERRLQIEREISKRHEALPLPGSSLSKLSQQKKNTSSISFSRLILQKIERDVKAYRSARRCHKHRNASIPTEILLPIHFCTEIQKEHYSVAPPNKKEIILLAQVLAKVFTVNGGLQNLKHSERSYDTKTEGENILKKQFDEKFTSLNESEKPPIS